MGDENVGDDINKLYWLKRYHNENGGYYCVIHVGYPQLRRALYFSWIGILKCGLFSHPSVITDVEQHLRLNIMLRRERIGRTRCKC